METKNTGISTFFYFLDSTKVQYELSVEAHGDVKTLAHCRMQHNWLKSTESNTRVVHFRTKSKQTVYSVGKSGLMWTSFARRTLNSDLASRAEKRLPPSPSSACNAAYILASGVARIWRWGGTRSMGNGSPPAGSRGRTPGGWFGGCIAYRKLIAVIKENWLPNHA